MGKDLLCSVVEVERFLKDHDADPSITEAFKKVKYAVYDTQIKSMGLQACKLSSSQSSAQWKNSKAEDVFSSLVRNLFCGCIHNADGIVHDDDTLLSCSSSSECKYTEEVSENGNQITPRKGWLISGSRRDKNINYDSDEECAKYMAQLGKNWNMDFFAMSNFKFVLRSGPVVAVGHQLIDPVGDKIHPDFNKLITPVLNSIQDVYLPNPYHNALHGACVAHMSCVLLKALSLEQYLTPLEQFAYLIAALGHDAGHPGKTNAFLRSTQNPLALIYNDASILENYHASLVCHIIRAKEDFFGLFNQQDWEIIRKRIIQLVLATDMMTHFTHVNNVKERRLSGTFDYVNNPEDLWFCLVLLVKTADIGHNFLPWCEHLPWTNALFDEFHMQGDEERLLSLPLLLFFDRTRSADIPDSQLGFFQGFTSPLIDELTFINTNSTYLNDFLNANAHDNLEHWKKNSKRQLVEIVIDLEKSEEVFEIKDATVM
ncbi:3'5'-cyclic nucleotide phosphodiesterase family protein [Babesia bovis T2Bo]|uniref:3'5'-cyclic nucleotide phosphodiesterase, putative n=1 Tax=Babesia bovis TaxID=5865 RepID=A7AS42_BABBO|nr:3'5'-cyclic nucleotide phosphodiesterase family protein [Babesia bovis T2Bo]EDO07361.1 3'5'-cyclic nucleotide phosphodiesterase family protein [Babesia bovis T2Bo]|eukprot:XP_001610929.1 3'5'-cyclic nucleotide phosphodiesterase [Babesia bovis T2Bo]